MFLHCYNKGHDALQVTALHVLSDILITHPHLLSLPNTDMNLQKLLSKVLSKSLKAINAPDVQAAGTTALCKLMLTNVVQDEDLLKQAVICYIDPATKENAAARQALSYFLPVYCHSRRENMARMATVTPSIIHAVLGLVEEMDEEDDMVGTGTVGNMLVDWTDARKLVIQEEGSVNWDEAGRKEIKAVNGDIHLSLAENLLEKVMGHGCTSTSNISASHSASQTTADMRVGEEKKAIFPLLSKLYISSSSTQERLQTTHELAAEAIDMKIANDAASRNGLNKLYTSLTKAIGETKNTKKSVEEESVVDTAHDEITIREETADKEDVMIELNETKGVKEVQDSLLEDLLDDDE